MLNAQEWLDKNYPDKEKTWTIYLNQQLAGVLDCSEYKNLWTIFISASVDGSKLEIKKGSHQWVGLTEIIPCPPAQTWLNQQCPQQARKKVKVLNISGRGLEGSLDLSDFKNLEVLDCSDNCLTNLNVNNCGKLKKIYCWNNQLTTLKVSNLAELGRISCSNNYLTQIPYFPSPEKIIWLDISNNNINPSNLTFLSQMRNLERLDVDNNNKNKINQNIYNHFVGSCEPLKDLNNLWGLYISNTDLNSGWKYLPNNLWYFAYDTHLRPNCKLAKVKTELEKELWIDIHQNFVSGDSYWTNKLLKKIWFYQGFSKEQTKKILEEWSPLGVRPQDGAFINWFLNFKKLDLNWAGENEEEFKELRDKYENFKTCSECRQPNTSWDWCQSCNAKHFKKSFKKEHKKWYNLPNKNEWTSGNKEMDKFIQQCQLKATSSWNILEWIPYEKFTNIEHIANGGFGKVEKAEWEGGSISEWDNEKKDWKRYGDYGFYSEKKIVALKTLSNSQNLNQNFLSELMLYKMFKSEVSQMVPCYGISQDKEGNYIMVMEYMKEGNLREFLRKNSWLGLERKLKFLKQITQGLKDIHRKKLVHRDFHSGNILIDEKDNCRITDLGLSQPVNETETEHTIYGLMPYMASEVLMGQPYTQKADIYSLGMVLYELITGLPPYAEQSHDINLALKILQGIRPQFPSQVKYPQILVDLIKKCWDDEPSNRPSAREISGIIGGWFEEGNLELKTDTEFYHQVQEALPKEKKTKIVTLLVSTEAFNETLPKEIKFPTYHSKEVWHSKPIDTKQTTELLTSQGITLDLGNLSIQNPQEESSTQAQIQVPPKK